MVVTEPLLRLADELRKVTPEGIETFFFGNSGAEAIEGSFKMARFVTHRPVVIGFFGGFHGRTYGSVSLTSVKSKYRKNYEPTIPGIYFAEYPNPYRCPWGATRRRWSTGASRASSRSSTDWPIHPRWQPFLIEPVPGRGRLYRSTGRVLAASCARLCDKYGILLIVDEIQTGFGRTGNMFASQTFGFRPDIMAIGKAIANGFPMGATASSQELMARWDYGSHGTTFGGNPIACAAGCSRPGSLRQRADPGEHPGDG